MFPLQGTWVWSLIRELRFPYAVHCSQEKKNTELGSWKVPKCSSAVEWTYKSWCSHMKEYYTAMKMENLPPPHISTKTGRCNPGHRSQEDGSPWGVGPGCRMKGSWGLNISCFLIWVVVTWVFSIYENLSSCTVKIHGCMHVILWPPHAKSWLIGKDPDAGRDWGQEEKGTTEDEMAGWHHRLDGNEFE